MSENDIVDSGIPLPRMASIQPVADFSLSVKWAEGPRVGRTDLVDLSPAVFSYKVYRPLRDELLFASARIAEDGDAISWGSDDLMMSADTVLSLAQESWTPKEFADFLDRSRLTQQAAAALLGRSRRQIANYLAMGPIPRIVTLACYGLEALRQDRFVRGNDGAIVQPPTIRTGSVPAPTEPPRSPVGSGQRQRA
jgi:hypothetical protein